MSKKVVVISTSLRKNSNSDALAQEFVKGAVEAGNEVEYVTLREKKINFCIGCMSCMRKGSCFIKDDVNAIADIVEQSDVVVYATPIYYYEMSGQMKTLIDRMNSLYKRPIRFREVYVLCTAAEEGAQVPEKAINGVQGWIDCFDNVSLKGSVFCGGVHEPGSVREREEMKQAYKMGRQV